MWHTTISYTQVIQLPQVAPYNRIRIMEKATLKIRVTPQIHKNLKKLCADEMLTFSQAIDLLLKQYKQSNRR